VALRLREIGQGGLRAVNVNERNTGLLSSLGLDQLFTVIPAASGGAEVPDESRLREAVTTNTGAEEQKKMVLEAHEALVEAESANAVKFKDVLDYMRQELNVPDTEKDG
jgi:hypothetical protein